MGRVTLPLTLCTSNGMLRSDIYLYYYIQCIAYFAWKKDVFRDEIERMDDETMMWDVWLSLRSPDDRVVGYLVTVSVAKVI